jgi:hypothetical protein
MLYELLLVTLMSNYCGNITPAYTPLLARYMQFTIYHLSDESSTLAWSTDASKDQTLLCGR